MGQPVSREQWRKTALAAMANYIDAESIVAGAVALPLWAKQFGFGDDFVSLLGAMSSNAISAGGVRRGDRAAAARDRAAGPGRVDAADPVRPAVRGRDRHVGVAAGDGRVADVGRRAEGRERRLRRVQGALPPHPRPGVPDRDVRRLEPGGGHVRVLLPLHPRSRRQHVRPRELRAAGDLVPVDRARGRHSTCR